MPQTYTDVVEMLIPELRKRGIFWDGYCAPGKTYRENMYQLPGQAEPLANHPAAAMIWRPHKADTEAANGINGLANGHMEYELDVVDPISMQLS